MKNESYPSPDMSRFVRRVHNVPGIRRDWTGNDESARNHHGAVHLNESPLRLRLSWRKSKNDPVRFIGVFDLGLRNLLEAGYVRLEPRSEDEIRLRFYHDWDNVIYIQVNNKGPRLAIGRVP